VGTVSIEKSERLSKILKARKIPHHVLNAKHHENEADIVAQAGRFKAVTISTNMAGRGTDIMLGGNPEKIARMEVGPEATDEEYEEALERAREQCAEEKQQVLEAGGLHILGTERHESRRIDNQLRGRSGRQGDPGSSRFYLSMEDDLLRIFGAERLPQLMLDQIPEDMPIESRVVSKTIEGAQRKVEGHHFDIRKHLLEYDDVMNMQREVVYDKRKETLISEELSDECLRIFRDTSEALAAEFADPKGYPEDWDRKGLEDALQKRYLLQLECDDDTWAGLSYEGLEEMVYETMKDGFESKKEQYGEEMYGRLMRFVLLSTIDKHWKEFLRSMDDLKGGIGLVGYAQRNPLNEYKREGFAMFENMMAKVDEDAAGMLLTAQIRSREEVEKEMAERKAKQQMSFSRGAMPDMPSSEARTAAAQGRMSQQQPDQPPKQQPVRRTTPKVGRNDPCPCGSGKKYKKCCGA